MMQVSSKCPIFLFNLRPIGLLAAGNRTVETLYIK